LKGFCAFLRDSLTMAQATTPEVMAAEAKRTKESEYAAAAAQAKAEKDCADAKAAKAAKAATEEQENDTPEVVAMEQNEKSNAPEADDPT
jgi:transcription initiation factor IIF auxiliary subunit